MISGTNVIQRTWSARQGGNVFSRNTVADSTTEAEYIAACEAAKEGVWIRHFLDDLGILPGSVKLLDLFCDNTGAIFLAKESRFHKKTKHIKRCLIRLQCIYNL